MRRIIPLILLALTCLHTNGQAQMIGIKTVPVATGDQFLLFPSENLGMGGVTIALEDALADPFTNPARGAFVEGTRFIGTPMFYSISMNRNFQGPDAGGNARTIPVGMLSREGDSFGGMLFAWQQLGVERPENVVFLDEPGDPLIDFSPSPTFKSDQLDNLYAFATGGFLAAGGRVALGMSLTGARLNGVEGVRLLYQQGNAVDQDGGLFQVRAGLTALLAPDKTLDVVLLHHRFNLDQRVDANRTEKDQTNGIGLLVDYVQQMEDGWRLGGQLVGNWQWHPKIPNYDLMQIPRDPGNSSAYNLGLGIARQYDDVTVGVDLIYEPIRSHTWANAPGGVPIRDASGQPTGRFIHTGEKTVENFFTFNNRIVRAGIRHSGEQVDLQVGVDVHTIRYHLDQSNYELQFERSLNERWSEWTLSTGIGLRLSALELRYLGRLTLGTGQPGIAWGGWGGCPNCARDLAAAESSFIIAPAGSLTLREARVFTSQFSIHVPIRRGVE